MFAEINEKDLVKDNQKEWSKKIIKKNQKRMKYIQKSKGEVFQEIKRAQLK